MGKNYKEKAEGVWKNGGGMPKSEKMSNSLLKRWNRANWDLGEFRGKHADAKDKNVKELMRMEADEYEAEKEKGNGMRTEWTWRRPTASVESAVVRYSHRDYATSGTAYGYDYGYFDEEGNFHDGGTGEIAHEDDFAGYIDLDEIV